MFTFPEQLLSVTPQSILLAGMGLMIVTRFIFVISRGLTGISLNRISILDTVLLLVHITGMILIPAEYVMRHRPASMDYYLPESIQWAGAGIFIAAIALFCISQAGLGRNFSATTEIRQGQKLITRGIYRYIRHPMYASYWLWGIAQALILPNWVAGLSMLVTFIPFYLERVPREERMMLEHFGDEYREYMARTGRVLPRFSMKWIKKIASK